MGIDPVGADPSNIHLQNRYAYANNNPFKFVDPDGRYTVSGESVGEVPGLTFDLAGPPEPAQERGWFDGLDPIRGLEALSVGGAAAKVGVGIGAIFGSIRSVGSAAKGVGAYGKVGGHHVHAKAAFKNHMSYNRKDGFSISQGFMKENGLDHAAMTRYQRQAFKELSQSGRANTLNEHTQIAVDALMAGGASRDTARSLTAQSLNALRNSGVRTPTNIPWH